MLTTDQVECLAEFESASWAIWSDEFSQAHCLESQPEKIFSFMLRNADRLNATVVFLGLNRSQDTPSIPFQNFHAMRHAGDRTLKCYIQDRNLTNLQGGYMTDINARDVSPNGNHVVVSQNDMKDFEKQLIILGQSAFKVICFGNRAFSALAKWLGCARREICRLDVNILKIHSDSKDRTLEVFRVRHYANRGCNNQYVKELKDQLAYLNKSDTIRGRRLNSGVGRGFIRLDG